jgi:hypothetical protein
VVCKRFLGGTNPYEYEIEKNTRRGFIVVVVVVVVLWIFTFVTPAYAYIDPDSGSVLTSAIIQ